MIWTVVVQELGCSEITSFVIQTEGYSRSVAEGVAKMQAAKIFSGFKILGLIKGDHCVLPVVCV